MEHNEFFSWLETVDDIVMQAAIVDIMLILGAVMSYEQASDIVVKAYAKSQADAEIVILNRMML